MASSEPFLIELRISHVPSYFVQLYLLHSFGWRKVSGGVTKMIFFSNWSKRPVLVGSKIFEVLFFPLCTTSPYNLLTQNHARRKVPSTFALKCAVLLSKYHSDFKLFGVEHKYRGENKAGCVCFFYTACNHFSAQGTATAWGRSLKKGSLWHEE
jgi:hypothetical protein